MARFPREYARARSAAPFFFAALLALGACGSSSSAPNDAGPSNEAGSDLPGGEAFVPPPPAIDKAQVDTLVKPIIDGKWTVGLIVGVVGETGRSVYAYGTVSKTSSEVPNGKTIFEIGSITKTFTSVLLAKQVGDGRVQLGQPVKELLTGLATIPEKNGKPITLEHLATHMSGLPRLPTNMVPKDAANPYVDYTTSQLYTFLSGYTLPREPSSKFEYSNLAVGLLGHALSLEAKKSYDALVADSITLPLAMVDTSRVLSTAQQARTAQGHNGDLSPTTLWNFDVLAPAGALRSTLDDMLSYVSAHALASGSRLGAAMKLTHEPRISRATGGHLGLSWFIDDGRYIWHNGGTGGFGTFAGFDKQTKRGIVVLSNTISTVYSPETQLGLALLKLAGGESPGALLLPPDVPVASAKLDAYAGNYKGTQLSLVIERQGDALWLVLTGQPKYHLYAKSETSFYLRVAPVTILFAEDGKGGVSMVFTQNGIGTFNLQKVP